MVKINSSHVFIAGGYIDSDDYETTATYLYRSTSGSSGSSGSYSPLPRGYTRLPDMAPPARYGHACGLVNNTVWVGGGWDGRNSINSVESFSLTTLAWSKGPPLPIATNRGRMMTVDGSLLMFGDKLIWQLKTAGGEDYWEQVGEMETGRYGFDILRMKLSDCISWNIQ